MNSIKKERNLPFYLEINDFLESISLHNRTQNPLYSCIRLRSNDETVLQYKPPFKKDFYFISLITNAGETKITYDTTNVSQLDSFLVFQAPGQVYSFMRDYSAHGYLIYFKKECLSFLRPDFDTEFPFFNILQTNFFKLNQLKFNEFRPHFEYVFEAYENGKMQNNYQVASARLLALLYQLKEFSTAFDQWEKGFTTPHQILFQKFIRLVNNYYLEKRTVEDYSSLLNVTSNHLSQSIKLASSKNALSFINERIVKEAKSLILYTKNDIAEIAYQLNFSDPANFGKFFKKYTDLTPVEFRKQN